MGTVCAEHLHNHNFKFNPLMSSKRALQDLNIPPRKLLSSSSSDASDYFSPSAEAAAALMHKFLPCNGESSPTGGASDGAFDPDDDDPYSSDVFRMYEFKVRKCTRSRSHDWTDCPFSHPGEKARRRDPRKFHYSGTVCPEYRRSGGCSRGDDCEFAHGVFECYLHPARYRTEACKDGKNCKRKVCFFAHSPRELRVLPVEDDEEKDHNCSRKSHNGKLNQLHSHCCMHCCSHSPTSTLLGFPNFSSPPMSPTLSPPITPMKAVGARGHPGFSRYSDRVLACAGKGVSYADRVIADLLASSFDGMNINEALSPNDSVRGGGNGRGLWVDVNSFDNGLANEFNQHQQQQMPFSVSPSTPINQSVFSRNLLSAGAARPSSDSCVSGSAFNNINNVDESPDLGWVNDLLM